MRSRPEIRRVVVAPIGFLSEHSEILYDLDIKAQQAARDVSLEFQRSAMPSSHSEFVAMVVDLIEERLTGSPDRTVVGRLHASPDQCPANCCPPPEGAHRRKG